MVSVSVCGTFIMALFNQVVWDPKKICGRLHFEINEGNSNFIPLKFVPQKGPQCGFAAICMIASSVEIELHPDDLVKKATKLKMTNHGEMFSAQDAVNFAKPILGTSFELLLMDVSLIGLFDTLKKIIDAKNLILVPYDCDYNNEPCLNSGTTAHWAVICGYVDGGNEDDFYVLACHGKSRYVSLWKYTDLQKSNDNLVDIGQKRKMDTNEYVLPAGGLKCGIASKWIVFKRL